MVNLKRGIMLLWPTSSYYSGMRELGQTAENLRHNRPIRYPIWNRIRYMSVTSYHHANLNKILKYTVCTCKRRARQKEIFFFCLDGLGRLASFHSELNLEL
jgi:hypothetical protein